MNLCSSNNTAQRMLLKKEPRFCVWFPRTSFRQRRACRPASESATACHTSAPRQPTVATLEHETRVDVANSGVSVTLKAGTLERQPVAGTCTHVLSVEGRDSRRHQVAVAP